MNHLRVWCIINPPNHPTRIPVSTPEEGARLISAMAHDQLSDDAIVANAFGLEVFEDGEWCDWQDDQGNDVDDLMEELGI